MTKSVYWMRFLTLAIIGVLFINVLAQANVYDKFRNRERTNKGYLSEEEEIKLAAQVHQEVTKQARLNQDPALNNYINSLGQSLARNSERRNLPWRFFVVDDKSVNAFATLGGYVYVHTGLISTTTSEAQLASVIGHEIGHIVGRHGLENVKKAQKMQFGVMGAAILGAILGGERGAQAGADLGGLVAGGFLMKHGRDAEREADFLGLYNIERAGYNTGGMIDMFQMLASLSPNQMGSILSSHPPPAERANNTRREIDERLRGTDGKGINNTNEYQRVKGSVPAATAPRKVRPRN
ncbi:MAG: M48 family metallopeptidase [Blastocatellia bacterium]